MQDACARVAEAARKHGKIAVIGGVNDPLRWRELLELGFAPLVFAGIDTDVIAGALNQRLSDWRARFAG